MSVLQALVDQLMADGELSDADRAAIHDAAVHEANAILATKRLADRAHVHDVPHLPEVFFDPVELATHLAGPNAARPPGDFIAEHVDASDVVCHDCGRELVNDARHQPVFVCPSLHGRRIPLTPTVERGAIECGVARA